MIFAIWKSGTPRHHVEGQPIEEWKKTRAPVGNQGICDERQLFAWVENNLQPMNDMNFILEPLPFDVVRIKKALEQVKQAGWQVLVGCGCGDGWSDPRCWDTECVSSITERVCNLARFQ